MTSRVLKRCLGLILINLNLDSAIFLILQRQLNAGNRKRLSIRHPTAETYHPQNIQERLQRANRTRFRRSEPRTKGYTLARRVWANVPRSMIRFPPITEFGYTDRSAYHGYHGPRW